MDDTQAQEKNDVTLIYAEQFIKCKASKEPNK